MKKKRGKKAKAVAPDDDEDREPKSGSRKQTATSAKTSNLFETEDSDGEGDAAASTKTKTKPMASQPGKMIPELKSWVKPGDRPSSLYDVTDEEDDFESQGAKKTAARSSSKGAGSGTKQGGKSKPGMQPRLLPDDTDDEDVFDMNTGKKLLQVQHRWANGQEREQCPEVDNSQHIHKT